MLSIPCYPYQLSPSFSDYEFESDGPKGKLKKVARFTSIDDETYNFAFGDLDQVTGELNDSNRSDNKDMEKVLATVATIITEFMSSNPAARVFIQGSTASRTRLYQIHINKYWYKITEFLDLWGFRNDQWETFATSRNYQAFVARKK